MEMDGKKLWCENTQYYRLKKKLNVYFKMYKHGFDYIEAKVNFDFDFKEARKLLIIPNITGIKAKRCLS